MKLPAINVRRVGATAIAAVLGIFALTASFNLVENVKADEIVVIQDPLSGRLNWYTTPGPKWQGFGHVTTYKRRSIYTFESKIRFNDGAHAVMKSSIQYEMPLDPARLTAVHTRFGSQPAVQQQLVQTVVDKSIYMSGPLMSSQESYAEKRNALINYVEDQVALGVYRTTQKDVTSKDPLTGVDKTVTVVDITLGVDGMPRRQEEAVLKGFGVKPFNFSITSLDYDPTVEAQITEQQKARGAVITAMANARKSEQDAVTAEKNGQAAAATARWKQEAIKAAAVTFGEQQRDVAKLESEAAGYTKARDIQLGEGEAQKRRLIMAADGALSQKLEAYVKVNGFYATALREYNGSWSPTTIIGSSGAGGFNSGTSLIEMLTAKTARDLSLDMSAKK